MTEFVPDVFVWGDRAGQGRWEVGHYRQHENYVTFLARLFIPILIPTHPMLSIGATKLEQKLWLEDHAAAHEQLRIEANVTGVDLASVDFEDVKQFQSWLDDHAREHHLIDVAFGL